MKNRKPDPLTQKMKQQKRTLRRRGKTTPMKECRKQNEGHIAWQELQEHPASHLPCKERKPQNSKRCKKMDKERKRKQARMPLLYHHTKCIPIRGPHRTGTNSKIQMTNQIHTKENSEDNEIQRRRRKQRTDNYRTLSTEQTHPLERSVLLLQQQIILHCNSGQILSIPKHTARQGSQCSDKKTARCNKSYIKKAPQRVQQQRTAEKTNTGRSKQAHTRVWRALLLQSSTPFRLNS